jgi:hypothetical protein
MTEEQQRIAIAEACGWKQVTLDNKPEEIWENKSNPLEKCRAESKLPNYAGCLNAMHEAEKVLTEEQRIAYSDHTYDIACEEQDTTGMWSWLSLTASQRAKAFLQTLGKWEEE